ncbi:MAG: AhpC/TSA family protein [Gammaproteobacteria bacterium]|nr:AhpC/TSA family protein [Gammaproteobacteria bacterium]MBL4729008.1 AhpC/TSA family protein [Gammaproteobacteria bacterium]
MAQLCQRQQDLDRLKVRVLIISFSAPAFARAWLEETNAPFSLLLDENRDVYQKYGLERSFLRSWSPKTIWYYLLNWKARPKSKLPDDLNQLGGDYIVDAQGILRFVYPSYEPVDRPSMNQLFSVLESC